MVVVIKVVVEELEALEKENVIQLPLIPPLLYTLQDTLLQHKLIQ